MLHAAPDAADLMAEPVDQEWESGGRRDPRAPSLAVLSEKIDRLSRDVSTMGRKADEDRREFRADLIERVEEVKKSLEKMDARKVELWRYLLFERALIAIAGVIGLAILTALLQGRPIIPAERATVVSPH